MVCIIMHNTVIHNEQGKDLEPLFTHGVIDVGMRRGLIFRELNRATRRDLSCLHENMQTQLFIAKRHDRALVAAQRWKYVLDFLVSFSMKRIPIFNTVWSIPFSTTCLFGNLQSVLCDYNIAIKSTIFSMLLITPHKIAIHVSQHSWHYKNKWYYKVGWSWPDKCWHILYAWSAFPWCWMWSCVVFHLNGNWVLSSTSLVPCKGEPGSLEILAVYIRTTIFIKYSEGRHLLGPTSMQCKKRTYIYN